MIASGAEYNFAYLDEQTKRMIRRALLKAVAIPGYQVPFASREMPMPYGWGTGGVQVTAATLWLNFRQILVAGKRIRCSPSITWLAARSSGTCLALTS